jgi:transposase InsO family protein
MNKFTKNIITSKWEIILLEYELIKKKKSNLFKSVEQLCEAHRTSRKQIQKYYKKWKRSGGKIESLLPDKRGPRKGSYRLLTKEQERVIIKIQREFEATAYETWCMIHGVWKLHPSVRTVRRILKRYPLNKKKEIIKRYEKNIPGELIHGDTYYLPKDLFKDKKQRYLNGMIDDCTRLCYIEMIQARKSKEVAKSFLRGGKWFDLHGIQIEEYLTDNGMEFCYRRSEESKPSKNHVLEYTLDVCGIKHRYTRFHRPQTNGKIERFWRILNEEFLRELKGLSEEEFVEKLKEFMYYYNYLRFHGGIYKKTPFQKLEFVTETLANYIRTRICLFILN